MKETKSADVIVLCQITLERHFKTLKRTAPLFLLVLAHLLSPTFLAALCFNILESIVQKYYMVSYRDIVEPHEHHRNNV